MFLRVAVAVCCVVCSVCVCGRENLFVTGEEAAMAKAMA